MVKAAHFHYCSVQDWIEMAKLAQYNARYLAQHIDISVRQLERYFKRQFSCSPQQWLDQQRMTCARAKLCEVESIKQLAFDLGFKQTSHFCRQFKKYHGVSAVQFLRAQIADHPDTSPTDNDRRSQIITVAQG